MKREEVERAEELWSKFEAALVKHTESGLATFRPPATDAQIYEAERALGLTFPEQLRFAYRKHDGTEPTTGPGALRLPLFVRDWWCSLAELVDTWKFQTRAIDELRVDDPDAIQSFHDGWAGLEIRPEWFNRFWIPIGVTDMPHYYVDMAPGPSGKIGQLIAAGETGGAEGVVVAPSLFDRVALVTRSLESGRLRVAANGYWADDVDCHLRWEPES